MTGDLTMRTTKRALHLVLGAVLSAGLIGCMSRGTAQNTYSGGEGLETEAHVGNPTLKRKLQMVDIRSERREDGRLRVQFELHNTGGANLSFEWAAIWTDERGFRIDVPEHWTPVSIPGHGYEIVNLTGPTPSASQWRMQVQLPNSAN
jgi:hypothetical protein